MADYKLITGGVIHVSGLSIPADAGNRHYIDYLAWVALGNTPDPEDAPTAEQLAVAAAIVDAPITCRAWFASNPNAKLIWSMTVAEVVEEIAALVDALLPLATAGNRVKLKLLLTGLTLAVRVLVKRESLD